MTHPNPKVAAYIDRMTEAVNNALGQRDANGDLLFKSRRAARKHFQRKWGYR